MKWAACLLHRQQQKQDVNDLEFIGKISKETEYFVNLFEQNKTILLSSQSSLYKLNPWLACAALFCSVLLVASYPNGSVAEVERHAGLMLLSCSDCVYFIISPWLLCCCWVGCVVKWLRNLFVLSVYCCNVDPEFAQDVLFWKLVRCTMLFCCLTSCLARLASVISTRFLLYYSEVPCRTGISGGNSYCIPSSVSSSSWRSKALVLAV